MDPSEIEALRALLTTERVLSLGVLVDGAPLVGLLPFAARPDAGALLVHASRLARHSAGLSDGAPFAAVIHGPDGPEADPLQLPRVSLQGRVRLLEKGGEDYASGREAYTGKLPGSEITFGLGDFDLYELVWERGRLVLGFGRARNLSRATLDELV